MKHRKIKFLLIGILVITIVGTVSALSYLAFKHYRQVERYQEALLAFENENWELAEERLQNSLNDDPNNEEILVRLARVNEAMDNWSIAGAYWAQAAQLNAFKSEYKEQMIDALLIGGNFNYLKSELERMRPLQTDRQRALLSFANSQSGNNEEAVELIKQLGDSPVLSSPLGRLIHFYVRADQGLTDADLSELKGLSLSDDRIVSFYAYFALADQSIRAGRLDEAEAYLKERLAINSTLGSLSLANFYYVQGESDAAARIYGQYVEQLNPVEAIRYAEMLAANQSVETLESFAQRYRSGTRGDVLTGFYIDALIGYLKGDETTVMEKFNDLGENLPNTPLAGILKLTNAINQDQLTTIVNMWEGLPFDQSGALTAYITLLRPYIIELMAEDNFQAAAQLSGLIQARGQDDIVFTVAIITDAFQQGVLSQYSIERALEKYPNDPRLLSIAASFFLETGDIVAAQKYAKLRILDTPDDLTAQLQLIAALELLKDIDQAASDFEALYFKNASDLNLLMRYLAFSTRNQLFERLERLEGFLNENSALATYAPLISAEIANIKSDRQGVYRALTPLVNTPADQIRFENADLFFRTANLLGRYDYYDPAISTYQKLLKIFTKDVMIRANLSELYAARGQSTQSREDVTNAFKYAREGYELSPNSKLAIESYAQRLFEKQNFPAVEKLLYPLVQKKAASPRSQQAWKVAVEHLIDQLAEQGEVFRRASLCEALLQSDPENPLALEQLAKIKSSERKLAEEEAELRKIRESELSRPSNSTAE